MKEWIPGKITPNISVEDFEKIESYNSEPKWMIFPLLFIIGMLVVMAFSIAKINNTIQLIPKETIQLIHTELNP